jgi:hypothetical protein
MAWPNFIILTGPDGRGSPSGPEGGYEYETVSASSAGRSASRDIAPHPDRGPMSSGRQGGEPKERHYYLYVICNCDSNCIDNSVL